MKSNKGGVNHLALMMMMMIVSQLGPSDPNHNEENSAGDEHQEEAKGQ